MSWSDERVEKLSTLWNRGDSASLVARQLGGTTRNAVIGKLKRLGLLGGVRSTRRDTVSRVSTIRLPRPAPPAPKRTEPRIVPQAPTPPKHIDKTVRVSSILDLEPHHCRYIPGEPTEGYCGDHVTPSLSYCAHHASVCLTPATPKRVNDQAFAANNLHHSRKIGLPEKEIFEPA